MVFSLYIRMDYNEALELFIMNRKLCIAKHKEIGMQS